MASLRLHIYDIQLYRIRSLLLLSRLSVAIYGIHTVRLACCIYQSTSQLNKVILHLIICHLFD